MLNTESELITEPAEWQCCPKYLLAAENIASKTEQTDLADSQDKGDWTLISIQSRRKNLPPVMNVPLCHRLDALELEGEDDTLGSQDQENNTVKKLV